MGALLQGETTTTSTTTTSTTTTTTTSSTEEGYNGSNMTRIRLEPLELDRPLDVPSCYDRRYRLMPGPWLDCDIDYKAYICFKDLCNGAKTLGVAVFILATSF